MGAQRLYRSLDIKLRKNLTSKSSSLVTTRWDFSKAALCFAFEKPLTLIVML